MQYTLKRTLSDFLGNLNLFHEYRNVNSTLLWEKACSAAFSCHDVDKADGLPVLNGTAVVNAICSI